VFNLLSSLGMFAVYSHSAVKSALLLLSLFLIILPACAQPPLVEGRVIPLEVNLRLHDLPATWATTIGALAGDATVQVQGRTPDSAWLYVEGETATGWGVADYFTVESVEAVPVRDDWQRLPPEITLPDAVIENIRIIFRAGQGLGNRRNVFSKVGDSITANPFFLAPVTDGAYRLGDHQSLHRPIAYFDGTARDGLDSFSNTSLAAAVGWSTDAPLNPRFADPVLCQPGEVPLVCEYRLVKPAVALIMYGTNDVGFFDAESYEGNLARIVRTSIEMGVIPVLSTIPVRLGYEERVIEFNGLVAEVADRFDVPLWEYGAALDMVAGFGLAPDGVHPSLPPQGVRSVMHFDTANLNYGFVIRNLTALQMLDAIVRVVA
jgi:hypothetical protein